MEKIINEDKQKTATYERKIVVQSDRNSQREKKAGQAMHENWMRTFMLLIFVCFLWHIALVYRVLYCYIITDLTAFLR